MMCAKRYAVFFVVFLLVCSSAWAIPGIRKPSEEKPSAESTSEVIIIENSESEANVKYVSYEELSKILNGRIEILGTERIDTILTTVDKLEQTVKEQNEEIARQDQEIAEVKAAYAKEMGTKYFADLGAAFGFKDTKVQYGFVGDMGLRFGKGLMVKTGVQYMVGDLGQWKAPSWSIDNLTVSATVGWEW